MLERFFHLKSNGTTPSREVIGGVTTFAAMAYILAVNPAILKDAGMDQAALVWVGIMMLTGELRQVEIILYGLTTLFVLKFVFVEV